MSDGAGKYERLTEAGIENVVRSFFDEYEKENAEFRSQSGLAVEVIREEVGDCCDWCADIAGNYDYWDAPKEVWQRHEHCRCMVITRTTKGTYQDAWSKKEYQSQREARIASEERIKKELQEQQEQTSVGKESKPDFFVGKNGKVLLAKYESWIGDNKTEEYLSKVTDDLTKRYIETDYRRYSFIGDGGTAAIRKFEIETGLNCGRNETIMQ